jgi:hypothetical protein
LELFHYVPFRQQRSLAWAGPGLIRCPVSPAGSTPQALVAERDVCYRLQG